MFLCNVISICGITMSCQGGAHAKMLKMSQEYPLILQYATYIILVTLQCKWG